MCDPFESSIEKKKDHSILNEEGVKVEYDVTIRVMRDPFESLIEKKKDHFIIQNEEGVKVEPLRC